MVAYYQCVPNVSRRVTLIMVRELELRVIRDSHRRYRRDERTSRTSFERRMMRIVLRPDIPVERDGTIAM